MPLVNSNLLPSLFIAEAIDRSLTGKLDNKLISWQEDLVLKQAKGAVSHTPGTPAPGSTASLLVLERLSW